MSRKIRILLVFILVSSFDISADEIKTGDSYFTSIVSSFLESISDGDEVRFSADSPVLPSTSYSGEGYSLSNAEECSEPIFTTSDYSSSLVGASYPYPGADPILSDNYESFDDGTFSYSILWNPGEVYLEGDEFTYSSGGSSVTLYARASGTYIGANNDEKVLTAPTGYLVLVDANGKIFSSMMGGSSEYVKRGVPIDGGEWIYALLLVLYAVYMYRRKRREER